MVQNQAAMIESLKKDKKAVEDSFESLKTDHERLSKENHVLRRAVQIQQDRQNQTDAELKNAHKYKIDSEERITAFPGGWQPSVRVSNGCAKSSFFPTFGK